MCPLNSFNQQCPPLKGLKVSLEPERDATSRFLLLRGWTKITPPKRMDATSRLRLLKLERRR